MPAGEPFRHYGPRAGMEILRTRAVAFDGGRAAGIGGGGQRNRQRFIPFWSLASEHSSPVIRLCAAPRPAKAGRPSGGENRPGYGGFDCVWLFLHLCDHADGLAVAPFDFAAAALYSTLSWCAISDIPSPSNS